MVLADARSGGEGLGRARAHAGVAGAERHPLEDRRRELAKALRRARAATEALGEPGQRCVRAGERACAGKDERR